MSMSSFMSRLQESGVESVRNQSQLCEEMPQALLFPTNKPSSRADAVLLDQWVSKALRCYAQRSEASASGEEDLARAVEELIPLLSIGLHETVRQVGQHCLDRAVVLEKIWRTYVDLFEAALAETRAALKRHKEKTAQLEEALEQTRQELAALQELHPRQIAKLSKTISGKHIQREEHLGHKMGFLRQDNEQMQKQLDEQQELMDRWFPNFSLYKNSILRRDLRGANAHIQAALQAATMVNQYPTPEAYLCIDIKRILLVMQPQSRKRVGYYIASLLGLRGTAPMDTAEGLRERREHNQHKILELEARLADLSHEDSDAAGGAGAPEKPKPPAGLERPTIPDQLDVD